MQQEIKSYKGKQPATWRSRAGYWILCYVDSEESYLWDCVSKELLITHWNQFVEESL